jgi:2-octaprenyl-6-methoxyphenol hydroxylase
MVDSKAEAVVVGAGPAGLTAAITLAAAQVPIILIAKRAEPDNRTTALLASSVVALETLGVWQHCRAQFAPLRVMRLADDTGRLLRAPEARFAASEIGLDAFGYNIENRHLLAALETRAQELPSLIRIADEVRAIEPEGSALKLSLTNGGHVAGRIAIGADGRRSLCRAAAGIGTRGWSYPQVALTFNISHSRQHDGTSTEFHTETGPFTLVPLPGMRSSVVCVVDTVTAERLANLDDEALADEIEQRAHSVLGKVTIEAGRGRFPLSVETAQRFGANRIALVGEAAHIIPPIGAQGLNLGLRDAATIGELIIGALRMNDDPGSDALLSRYETLRRADVASRTFAVDLLNRTLLSSFLPFQGARGLGLFLMNQIGPLRRAAMREGVAPMAQPRLMRGEALV